MSRNGSGVYTPSATGYPAVASTTIESAKYNAVIADIATALTLSIAANGETTVTANIPLAGYKITGLGNASADTDALNRVTADARYGLASGPSFTGTVNITAAIAQLTLNESDAGSNEKEWHIRASGGNFYLYTATDAGVADGTALAITRTGTTVDSIALTTTAFTVNSIDLLPSSGNFTMELATEAAAGSVLANGTAYWKKVCGVVTLRCPALYATTTDDTLFIRGIPAAIQPALTGTYTQGVTVGGLVNGSVMPVEIRIAEGVAYWSIIGLDGTGFTGGSALKGIGTATNTGPTITYQVTD